MHAPASFHTADPKPCACPPAGRRSGPASMRALWEQLCGRAGRGGPRGRLRRAVPLRCRWFLYTVHGQSSLGGSENPTFVALSGASPGACTDQGGLRPPAPLCVPARSAHHCRHPRGYDVEWLWHYAANIGPGAKQNACVNWHGNFSGAGWGRPARVAAGSRRRRSLAMMYAVATLRLRGSWIATVGAVSDDAPRDQRWSWVRARSGPSTATSCCSASCTLVCARGVLLAHGRWCCVWWVKSMNAGGAHQDFLLDGVSPSRAGGGKVWVSRRPHGGNMQKFRVPPTPETAKP
ncbi:hypothetical protein BC834DRAFT_325850 [Gloeopeniophorella convolvens]|nr:hypothetical protein BC834DRAFT_325850 [Gloeopeniophorella convolvens]